MASNRRPARRRVDPAGSAAGPDRRPRPRRTGRQGAAVAPVGAAAVERGVGNRLSPRTAREVAAVVLLRICCQGAFAMRALDAAIRRAGLDERDGALATEIVYGTLRAMPSLDGRLSPRLRKGLAETDPLTLAVLRTAAYQLLHLGRLPVHAIVDGAVGFIHAARSRQSAGFVNAVLRRLAEERPADPQPADHVVLPDWLQVALRDSLGSERAAALSAPRPCPPPLCLAVADGDPQRCAESLRQALPRGQVVLGELSPLAVLLRRAGDVRRLPAYAAGEFWVQEEGAQLVALAVDPQPGERLADLCAGHGGKTLCLHALRDRQGPITAVDVDETKLAQTAREFSRLGWSTEALSLHPLDLTIGVGGLPASFDRVLVDAPCSGLGTVLRRPELLLRITPDDPLRFQRLQAQIVRTARALVRDGGQLFVAVCSPLKEEGAELAAKVLADNPELRPEPADVPRLGLRADPDGVLRIGPWLGRGESFPDAYQVLRFVVQR